MLQKLAAWNLHDSIFRNRRERPKWHNDVTVTAGRALALRVAIREGKPPSLPLWLAADFARNLCLPEHRSKGYCASLDLWFLSPGVVACEES